MNTASRGRKATAPAKRARTAPDEKSLTNGRPAARPRSGAVADTSARAGARVTVSGVRSPNANEIAPNDFCEAPAGVALLSEVGPSSASAAATPLSGRQDGHPNLLCELHHAVVHGPHGIARPPSLRGTSIRAKRRGFGSPESGGMPLPAIVVAVHPHAMEDDGQAPGDSHGCLGKPAALGQTLTPGLQR